jgi:hypothetical protein
MSFKTLVIHPIDPSTEFLNRIYIDKNWTVINDPNVSGKELKEQIKAHDRIIMLGHGTFECLASVVDGRIIRFLIDSTFAYLLREKICVCIWCNADMFFKKYLLDHTQGLYTGMIISEHEEALLYSVRTNSNEILESNKLFAESIKECIDGPDPQYHILEKYKSDSNPIIMFNRENIFQE